MNTLIHDVRENWTEEQWKKYDEFIAEEAYKEDKEMEELFLDMQADYVIDEYKSGLI